MSSWQTFLREFLARMYRYSGAMWMHERMFGPRFLTILLFHRVNDSIPEDGLTVRTSRFRSICQMLRQRFQVVRLEEVFTLLREGRPLPRRTVAITFDDCYADNLQAAQVLCDYGLPATFFIPTGYIGTSLRFDWDRTLPPLPNLTWDQVRQIVRLGHDIGSHTVNHVNLGLAPREVAWAELVDSRQAIEEQLQRPCRYFAYPFGGVKHFRPEYLPLVEQAGYEGCFSAYGGFVRPDADPRMLPREAVPYFKSLSHLELHLSGCLHWWYDLRGRERNRAEVPGDFVNPHTFLESWPLGANLR
jgi:peptidoglycan/xylan/chitin deacetylase (PgdA/CDA1 family)